MVPASGDTGLILRGDHFLGENLASLVEDGLPCGLWRPHRDADAPGIFTVPLLNAAGHLPQAHPATQRLQAGAEAFR